MPELDFKGKQHIYAHHLTVPVRTLEVNASKSFSSSKTKPSLDDNLIIHGDNLDALKALLPSYAGKINCIYIDPPYNTGNEGWSYNDNVNSPIMQEWLRINGVVDTEDLEKHEKWLCMMWPRLQLLKELLADDGVIFISIDDNEQHHLRMVMDEIFGEENFIATLIWNKKNVVQNDAKYFSVNHEYIVCYAKNIKKTIFNLLDRTKEHDARYSNPDNDSRGVWTSVALQAKSGTENNVYEAVFSNGVKWKPTAGTFPRLTKESLMQAYKEGRLWFGKNGKNVPRLKKYLSEVKQGVVSNSILLSDEVGSTQLAKENLKTILNKNIFETPKPIDLIKRFVKLATDKNGVVLDSMAGSGTTGHAVLELNKEDGGNRKFILVECEDYADKVTAERIRRVIKGVPKAKNENLKEGLGGSFTFCKLGGEIELESMLTGKHLPSFELLAKHLIYISLGISPDKISTGQKDGFFYETETTMYYLIYEPKLTFLRSNESALDEFAAERIEKEIKKKNKNAVVFASHKFITQKDLSDMNITFSGLPYAAT